MTKWQIVVAACSLIGSVLVAAEGAAAVQTLLDLGHEAGLIPHRVQVEFVR